MGGSGKQEGGSAVSSGSSNPSDNVRRSDSDSASQKKKGEGKAAAAAVALKKMLDNKANQNNPNHPSYYASRGKNAQKKEKRRQSDEQLRRQPPDRVVDLRKKKQSSFPKKTPKAAASLFSGSLTQKKMSLRKKVQIKLKHPFQLLARTVKAREALESRYYVRDKPIRAQILERRRKALGLALDGVHKLEFSLNRKVQTFAKQSKKEKMSLRGFRANMGREQMLNGIIRDLEQDKIFENKVAYMYLCAILDPENYKNIGIPDQYNGARSGKPTIITEYIVPFNSDGEAAVIVSDDPLQHLTVLRASTTSQSVKGPTWANDNKVGGNGVTWTASQAGNTLTCFADPYSTTAKTSTFKVGTGSDGTKPTYVDQITGEPIQLANTKIDGKTYDYLPCAASDTFAITFVTPDITGNGFQVSLVTIVDSGSGPQIGAEGPTNVTGGAVSTGLGYLSITLAANTVGVYSYSVANTLAGTDATPNAYVSTTLVRASGDLVLPCGKANGDDVNFLIDYCDEYRSGACSVLSTYYGGYLENGLIIQGQLPKDDDFVLPPPSVQNWGLIPGIQTKALNDPEDPGAYTALIRRDYSSAMWDNLSEEDDNDTPGHEQAIIFLKANGSGAEFVRIRTALQFQYHTEVQSVYTDEGPVDEEALDLAINWLMEKMNGLSPNFGNCNHEQECDKLLREFEKERGGNSYSFFNGWFSGNETKLSNDGEIIV